MRYTVVTVIQDLGAEGAMPDLTVLEMRVKKLLLEGYDPLPLVVTVLDRDQYSLKVLYSQPMVQISQQSE